MCLRSCARMRRCGIVFSGSGGVAEEAKANELGAAFQVKPQSSEEYQAVVKRMAEFWLRGSLV